VEGVQEESVDSLHLAQHGGQHELILPLGEVVVEGTSRGIALGENVVEADAPISTLVHQSGRRFQHPLPRGSLHGRPRTLDTIMMIGLP